MNYVTQNFVYQEDSSAPNDVVKIDKSTGRKTNCGKQEALTMMAKSIYGSEFEVSYNKSHRLWELRNRSHEQNGQWQPFMVWDDYYVAKADIQEGKLV